MAGEQVNNKALETLCNEILKAVEVKAKTIYTQMSKKAVKISALSAYPLGALCFLKEGINPNLVLGGKWERLSGNLALNENGETVELANIKVWQRIG